MKPRRAGAGSRAVVAAATAAVSFALFAATACPTVPFGDAGELIAAAACLGVAHPPGYPVYTMLGWLALKLPAGEPAFRMNLLSALFAGLASGAAAWFVGRATGSATGAIIAGLALAVSSTFWSVATVAEVYSMHVFLVLLLLGASLLAGLEADPARRGRALTIAGAVLGVGLAHHPTIVLALPAAASLALLRLDGVSSPRRGVPLGWLAPLPPARYVVLAAVLAGVIPAVAIWSLTLRARLDPPSNWGRVSSLGPLWTHVSAAAYRYLDLGWAGLLRGASWTRLGKLLAGELSPVVFPLALLGIAGWPRTAGAERDEPASVRIAIVLLFAAGAVFGLRYATEDVQVFFLPSFLALVLAAGLGAARLLRHRLAAVRAVAIAAGVLLVAATAGANLRASNLRGMTAARDYARDVLATLPNRAALFVDSDDRFMILYLTQVLREREDVTIYDRTGMLFRDLSADMRLPPGPGEGFQARRIREEQVFIDRELSRPGGQPVFFLGWPGYEVPPRYLMEPVGLLYRIRPSSDPMEDDAALWASYHERQVREQATRTEDGFALGVAALYVVSRGERLMFLGDRKGAFALFEEASGLGANVSGIQNYVGTLYGRLGEYDLAIRSFRRALEVKPISLLAWNNLAMAYELAGRREEAKQALRRVIDLAPRDTDAAAALRRLEAATR